MSLLSLLFALAVERSMSSKGWQFSFYFKEWLVLARQSKLLNSPLDNIFVAISVVILPTLLVAFVTGIFESSLFELIFTSVVLLVCLGCHSTRGCYKEYLQAAFRGEENIGEQRYQQLLSDKQLPDIGLGQTLIWLNYRYFIAIILVFVCFGLPAVVFYRTLVGLIEYQADSQKNEDIQAQQKLAKLLFWIDWPMVRLVSFAYMLVGHFSRALPTWLETCFEFNKPAYEVLSVVAKQSEDFQLDEEDCTAEPCLFVRLAKRTLLLFLAVIAVLTITGVIH